MRALPLLLALLFAAADAQPNVVAEASVGQASYGYGEPIIFRYRLENVGTEAYRTTTSSSCVVGFTFGPVALPLFCTTDSVPFVLAPGQVATYEWTLVPADLGVPEADGTQTIWAHLGVSWGFDPSLAPFAASVTVEAPAYLGGPLAVGFHGGDPDAIEAARVAVGGRVLDTATWPDGTVSQRWQVEGMVLSAAIAELEARAIVRYAERAPRETAPRVTAAESRPGSVLLTAPVPNPTGGAAAVTLRLGQTAAVVIDVVDALGRRVAVLHDGPLAGGVDHRFAVEGGALPAGVYAVRVVGDGARRSQRLVVAR